MRLFLALALFSALAACSAMDGAPCSAPGTSQCSGTTMVVCEGATWRSYPCPACEGNTCNWKNAKNGAACPQVATGEGWCPFENRVLSCYWSDLADAGVFVETACQGCTQGQSLRELGKCGSGKCTCP